MTIIYHGWTPQTPKHEQIANGIASCKAFLQRDPQNAYWRRELEALEQERILDNITPEAHEEYIANLVHSAYCEMWRRKDNPQRDAETQARDVEKFGWYDVPEIKDGVSSPAWFEAQPEVEF